MVFKPIRSRTWENRTRLILRARPERAQQRPERAVPQGRRLVALRLPAAGLPD
jgi:hypothetical protein